ncbi:MAG TPA: hypothetical protein VIK62_09060 [Verrucomicrobiae bacterium]
MNKQLELFYLNKFKESFSNFPHGNIFPDEKPDFLIKDANEIVGVEITGFYRETASKTQRPLQQREGLRNRIIALAKSIYDGKELPSVYVTIQFDLNFYCGKSEVQRIAERFADLTEQSLSNLAEGKVWKIYDIQLKGVHSLSVEKREWQKSDWTAPLVSFLPTANPQQIQEILDEKNILCEVYRKKCNKIWLVIIMDRFKSSSFSLIPEMVSEHFYTHNFDSAFLFLYDHNHPRKPPILLKKE